LEGKHNAAKAEAARLRGTVKSVATTASLKMAAIQARIVDLDALKLLDVSSLEVNDDGELKTAPP